MNVALTLLSAVLLPLALPNEWFDLGVAGVGLIALVPAFVALWRTDRPRRAAGLGALFGAVSTAIANYWLAFFGDFSIWTIGGTVLAYTVFNYALFAVLHTAIHRPASADFIHDVWRPARIALLWTAYEFVKSVGFLGYPWGLVAYPVAEIGYLDQLVELTGTWGLSFLGALANAVAADWVIRNGYRAALPGTGEQSGAQKLPVRLRKVFTAPTRIAYGWIATSAALFLVLGLLGRSLVARIEPTGSYHVAVVQQNVDSWFPGRFSDALDTAQILTDRAMAQAQEIGVEPVAVLWSETVLRRPYFGPDEFYATEPVREPFVDFVRRTGVPLVTGAAMPANTLGDGHNSAILIDPDARLVATYAKQQLVPFAEAIPLWRLAPVRVFFREVIGLYGTWLPGSSSTVFSIPAPGAPIIAGAPICFEDSFAWVTRQLAANGAEVMFNLTNNSWSRQRSAQLQHFVAARLRTIELRMPLVRGTNSGVTAVIDARGVTTASLPMFESATAVFEVPRYPRYRTLYLRAGDWFGWGALFGIAAWLVTLTYRERKQSARRQAGIRL